MRILVTGSRTWDHAESIRCCLDALLEQAEALNESFVIVHGACPTGADQIADEWCLEQGRIGKPVRAERHPAKWSIHGKRAGFLRNDSMAALGADLCFAFIRDESKGATHCAEAAERYEIPVRLIDYATVTG